MAVVLNSSKRRLNDENIRDGSEGRTALDAWIKTMSNEVPLYAGRYFLGGRFKKISSTKTDYVVQWSYGENISIPTYTFSYVNPIQAGIKQRQELTGDEGRNAGALDAKRFCERIKAGCLMSDFMIPQTPVYIFLEVEDGTTLSADYWSAWAQYVKSFIMGNSESNGGPVIPFAPCIMCKFEKIDEAGKYVPSADINCLGFAYENPMQFAQCNGFWARAVETPTPDKPAIINDTTFEKFRQPAKDDSTLEVPILFWQFASTDETNTAISGWNLSVSNENVDIEKSMLFSFIGFEPTKENISVWGIDIGSDDVADVSSKIRTNGISGSGVDFLEGQKVSFIGRYYRNLSEHMLGGLTKTELDTYSGQNFKIISIFQAPFRDGLKNIWVDTLEGNDYFAKGFAYGKLDGADACKKAKELNQVSHTPIYFAVDVNPNHRDEYGESDTAVNNKLITDIGKYFDGVAAAYAEYLDSPGSIPYDIGIYADGRILKKIYASSTMISHYWELVGLGEWYGFYEHANIIQAGQDWLTLEDVIVDPNIAWGAEGSWNLNKEII